MVETRKHYLASLQSKAEDAAGQIREVAINLEEFRDNLPDHETNRRMVLQHQARRLRAIADALVAEANLGDPWTASKIAAVAGIALGAVTTAVLTGVGEGVGSSAWEHFVEKRDRAAECVHEVEGVAGKLGGALGAHIDDEIVSIAGDAHTLASVDALPGMGKAFGDGAPTGDLGVPNARQRTVMLDSVLGEMLSVARGLGDRASVERIEEMVERLVEVRQLVEMLAPYDDSLRPQRPIESKAGSATAQIHQGAARLEVNTRLSATGQVFPGPGTFPGSDASPTPETVDTTSGIGEPLVVDAGRLDEGTLGEDEGRTVDGGTP